MKRLIKKFPIVTLLTKNISNNSGPIILNASNEVLVNKFLKNQIGFNTIFASLKEFLGIKDFKKYAIKRAQIFNQIYMIDKWARNKTLSIIKTKK